MPFDYTKYPGITVVGTIRKQIILHWEENKRVIGSGWRLSDGQTTTISGFDFPDDEPSLKTKVGDTYTMEQLIFIEREYRVHQLIDYIMRSYKLSSAEEDYVVQRIKQDFGIN